MFMSKGELFHESSWALWFQHAAGLLPVSALQTDPGEMPDTIAECSCPNGIYPQTHCESSLAGAGAGSVSEQLATLR